MRPHPSPMMMVGYVAPPPPPPPMDVLVSPGGPGGSGPLTLVTRNNGAGGTHSVITSTSFTATVSNDYGFAPGPLDYLWTSGGTFTVINGQGTNTVTVSRDTADNDDTGSQLVICTITDTSYSGYSGGARDNADFARIRFISA